MRAFVLADMPEEVPFAEVEPRTSGAQLVWLHIDGTQDSGRTWIVEQSHIPAVARNALQARETRPRSEQIEEGAIINMRAMGRRPDEDPDPLVSIRFWAERGRVISFAYREPLALEKVIAKFLSGAIDDPGDLLTAFAVQTTAELDPEIAALGDKLDSIEARIDENNARSTRRRVSRIRAEAIGYRRFVSPQREALERMAVQRCTWLDEEDRLHLREAADRYARMAEELEAVRDRAAIVHDELTDLRGETMDSRALLISIVALIFLPLTFITGLLGMNVEGIPYAREPWAFWAVVGFCVLLGLIVLGYFIRVRWVRGR